MSLPNYVLRLPGEKAGRPRAPERLLRRAWRGAGAVPRAVVAAFAFKCDEARFARALLSRRSQLWLFRSNQRRFCGDFVVVDMSSPTPARRPTWVIDLKLGASLRLGGGGAGIQLRNADRAVQEIAKTTGAVPGDAVPTRVTGGRRAVWGLFGVTLR